jgi:hypothetical protein
MLPSLLIAGCTHGAKIIVATYRTCMCTKLAATCLSGVSTAFVILTGIAVIKAAYKVVAL